MLDIGYVGGDAPCMMPKATTVLDSLFPFVEGFPSEIIDKRFFNPFQTISPTQSVLASTKIHPRLLLSTPSLPPQTTQST